VAVDEPQAGVDDVAEDEASELGKSKLPKPAVPAPATGRPARGHSGYNYDPIDVKIARKKLLVRRLRDMILKTGRRSDGRGVEDVRPISIETDLLPGAHGSSLFTRGETQSFSTATLGSKAMEQRYENLDELSTKRFYLQYRFPPSSVGEVRVSTRALLPGLFVAFLPAFCPCLCPCLCMCPALVVVLVVVVVAVLAWVDRVE